MATRIELSTKETTKNDFFFLFFFCLVAFSKSQQSANFSEGNLDLKALAEICVYASIKIALASHIEHTLKRTLTILYI